MNQVLFARRPKIGLLVQPEIHLWLYSLGRVIMYRQGTKECRSHRVATARLVAPSPSPSSFEYSY